MIPFSVGAARGTAAQQTGGSSSFWPSPRIRRPLDVARLTFASAVLAVLLVLALLGPDLMWTTARLIPTARTGMPRNLLSFLNVVVSFAVLGVLIAIAFDAVRRRRFSLTCATLACAVGILVGYGVGFLLGVVSGSDATTLLMGTRQDSAGLPIAATVSLLVGADLHHRRWSWAARAAVAAAIACALGQGSLTIPSAAFTALIGVTAGLGVRVVVGVVPARPPQDMLESVLVRAGFGLTSLTLVQVAAGRIRFAGRRPDGSEVRVTMVDPDLGGVPFGRRVWRLLRLRAAAVGRPALSLRGQLERLAVTTALARSAGVAAPEVLALLAVGPALVLVERPLIGARLPAGADPASAASAIPAFAALRRLHNAGLAHGALTWDRVVLLPDGQAGFTDFVAAQPAATELQRELDVVALLVTLATRAGTEAAASALRSAYGTSPVAEARIAALLQPLILPPQARRAVRRTPLLGDLRKAMTGPEGRDGVADLPRLERLRPRTVISVVGASIAVYLLATQISQVSIGSALQQAIPGWLAVAVVGSALTYLGSALTLQAFVSATLPLARTTLVQLAASFVALVTPPAVGHVGLNIRYLQRAGVPTPAAAAEVAVKEVVTVAVTVPVLLVCAWLSGVSGSRLALLPSGSVLIVLGAAAAIIAVVAIAPPTRRLLRRRLEPLVRRTIPQLLATLSDPRRLGMALVGVLVLNGGYVLALDASLRAFSASLALPALVVVYLAASTIGSAAPTPGGLGAVEAALVGGLTATGVPVAAAVTAVLAFRAATFWLPAPLGWGAFVALQRRGRI